MKTKFVILIFFVLSTFIYIACSRKTLPGITLEKNSSNYDTAAFNYVYVEGIKQKLMGNTAEALKYFEQCTKINPSSDAVYYQMAQILMGNGDTKNGKQYASRALELDKGNLWYLMQLASLYYQEKNLDSAILYYERAVKFYPEKLELQLTLGNLHSENNEFDEARDIFDFLDRKYGVNESSTLASINLLIKAEKYDEALIKTQLLIDKLPEEISYYGLLAIIYEKLGNKDKALEIYLELIKNHPEDPEVQVNYCEFLLSIQNYDELFIRLNSIVLNQAIPKEEKVTLFAQLIDETVLINESGNRLILALMVLEAAYNKDDIIPLLRPELLIKKRKLKEAALRLEEIIKTNIDNYFAWEKLLIVYLQLKEYQNLMIKGEECSSRFNRSFIAKVLYATGASETKNYEIALGELRKAEILAGDNEEYLIQVLTMKADIYYRMKDYTQAFELYEKALKSNNNDLTVMNNYAYYLAEQNQKLKEAEEMAKIVIEKEKDNTTYLDTYAWVLYKRGKINEAARIMETIINSGEKADGEWFEHYGYILKRQNNCIKAIENWNLALKLDSTKTHLIKEIENCKN